MTHDILSPRSDIVFRMLFGDARNLDILQPFLRAVLPLPPEEFDAITVLNSFSFANSPANKTSILDIKAKTKHGTRVNIEIQMANHAALRARALFYCSRMMSEQLGGGEKYGRLKPSICILLTNFILHPENRAYYNANRPCNTATHTEFSDLIQVHTLELPKVPPQLPPDTDNTSLWAWLRFLKAKNREELEMLAERHVEVAPAVEKLIALSANDEARMLQEARLDAERTRMAREAFVRNEGRADERLTIARNLLKLGLPVADIAAGTGLSREEIRALQDS